MQTLWASLLLFLLNMLDAYLTIVWLDQGLAEEANPLMLSVIEGGESDFLLIKMVVGAFAATVFFFARQRRLARMGLRVSLILYLIVTTMHIGVLANGGVLSFELLPAQLLAYI
jgi:hypothetical protein